MSVAITLDLDYSKNITGTAPMDPSAGGQALDARFRDVFLACYGKLKHYAFTLLKDETAAEEAVQTVFCRLWERNRKLILQETISAYLYKAVHNECLNVIKAGKRKQQHHEQIRLHTPDHLLPEHHADSEQVRKRIDQALESLPQQCRTIFQLSRFEQLKYREIAGQLGISVKTVENQMSKALAILRKSLRDFLPALLVLLLINKSL